MKKNHKPKKGSKRKSHKKRGLGTTSTKQRAKGLVSDLVDTGKTFAGHVGGFLGGALIAKGMDKIPFLAENSTDGKIVAIAKKLTKPVVLLGVGSTARILGKRKNMTFVKSLGEGLNVSAAYSGIKAFSKSEIFSGLGDAGDTSKLAQQQAEYYRENLEALKQVAEENKAQLKLDNPGDESEEGMNGAATIPGTQLNLVDNAMVL